MTEKIVVGLGERSYPIRIGAGILARLGAALKDSAFPRRVAVVTNDRVMQLYGSVVMDSLAAADLRATTIVLPDGEEFKNLQTVERIYDRLIAEGFDRSSGLVALGGGVIGDMTGFAAATFLRGIPFAQVPTTLLAQVDSSVGGKTGVNHRLGKNLIGAFHQPRYVHIDVATLGTLSPREFSAGLAEVVKYGIIRDRNFFGWLQNSVARLHTQEPAALIEAVKIACQIKADIVEIDERESSLRAVLNFGHTLGHAVETLTGYREFLHGEAVAIGMNFAATAANELGLCSREELAAIRGLLTSCKLPIAPPEFPLDDYLRAVGRDKKVQEGVLRLVLNRGIGESLIQEIGEAEQLFAVVLERLPNG